MKKRYLLLSGLILGSSMMFAQSFDFDNVRYKGDKIQPDLTEITQKSQKASEINLVDKVYGDTLYLETFDSNLNGWTVANNTGNTDDWEWHNGPPKGKYTGEDSIHSTSGPGFLAMRMDNLNSPRANNATPRAMNAWVTSPKLTIAAKESVYLKFEQFMRYNYAGANNDTLVVEVSTDGSKWSAYDARNGRGSNQVSDNPETLEIDVSKQLANETTAYIRFRVKGPSTYFWMVDDVALVEGPEDAIEIERFSIQYHSGFKFFAPNYRAYPLDQANDVVYSAYIRSGGTDPQTDVRVKAEVFHDSTLSGGAGTGKVYSEDTLVSGLLLQGQRDTTSIDLVPYVASDSGHYHHQISVSSDSANEFSADQRTSSYKFSVTDSTYALENNRFTSFAGPGGYVEGRGNGDKVAQLFIVEQGTYATSISLAIPGARQGAAGKAMHGLKFKPIIYSFEEDSILIPDVLNLTTLRAAFSANSLYNTPFPEIIDTATMGGRWNTFKLDPPVELQPGAYYVGVEQTAGANAEKGLMFYRDTESEKHAPGLSSVMSLANASNNPGWSTTGNILAIRLNTGKVGVGINENVKEIDTKFAVAPNPNNGEFKLFLNSQEAVNYTLNVHNMLGQVVHTEEISVNGLFTKDMSLKGYDKGVYFVSLVNDNERLVKKIVLK